MAKTLLIDTSQCIACRGCEVACKNWHDLPANICSFNGSYQTKEDFSAQTYTLVKMTELEKTDGFRWIFGKRQCMHCTDATCKLVCPQDALIRSPQGAIYVDWEYCIGCGFCVQNCPFQVPQIDETTQKMHKCDLCVSRIENGLIPACVKTCPTGAISFGEREEMLRAAQLRLVRVKKSDPKATIYGNQEVEGTIFYILTESPALYGLPPHGVQVPWQVKFWQWFARPIGEITVAGSISLLLIAIWFNYVQKPLSPEETRLEGRVKQ